MKINKNKIAFSLTELLVAVTIMSVLSLIVVVSVTKKTKKMLQASVSGTYICYKDMDGKLWLKTETTTRNNGTDSSESEVSTCEIEIPGNARNVTVYAIGGGGGGASRPDDEKINAIMYDSDNPKNNYGIKLNSYDYDTRFLVDAKTCYKVYATSPQTKCSSFENGIPMGETLIYEDINTVFDAYGNIQSFKCGSMEMTAILNNETGDSGDFIKKSGCSGSSDRVGNRLHTYNYGLKCGPANSDNIGGSNEIYKTVNDNKYNKSALGFYFKEDDIIKLAKEKVFKSKYIGKYFNYSNMQLTAKKDEKTEILSIPGDQCACYMGKLKCASFGGKDYTYVQKRKNDSLLGAEVNIYTTAQNVPVGNPGSDGETKKCTSDPSLVGRRITIDRDQIGDGGFVGHPGASTRFVSNNCNIEANGGNSGNITYESVNMKDGTIENDDKLRIVDSGTESKIEQNKNKVKALPENSDSRAFSSYYMIEGLGGALSIPIIPNTVCKENAEAGEKYIIEGYDSNGVNKNQYKLNYGGGGGGYAPCIKYGAFKSANVKYYDYEHDTDVVLELKEEDTKPRPIYNDLNSTRGMGGAIIIKWSSN